VTKAKQGKYLIIWEFKVRKGAAQHFRRAYGNKGDWAKFFHQGRGYLRTELFRDLNQPRRFFTLDIWASKADYIRFRRKFRAHYEAIDQRCEKLTQYEAKIGEFELV